MSQEWVKSEREIAALRESGRRLALVVDDLIAKVQPGISTGELGVLAETLIQQSGGDAIFKGYGPAWGAPPFPAAVCLSINNEVVHGIPKVDCFLKNGDLLKIDIGMRFQGMVSDMARMVLVGTALPEVRRLKEVTERALDVGIAVLRAHTTLKEYAEAVESVVRRAGFHGVRDLVGHGVGRELHEEPQIPNYVGSGLPNFRFQSGMTVALEPMVNVGSHEVCVASDGWTFVTVDGSLSGHVEDTVLITDTGSQILTRIS